MATKLVMGSDGFVSKPVFAHLQGCGETVIPFDFKRGENEMDVWPMRWPPELTAS